MMLANIVNGRRPKGEKGPRTTLLVASPNLLTQWSKEIELHTDGTLNVMKYSYGNRLDSNNALDVLESHDIILTTYTEVMRSYPKNEPPITCQSAEDKATWWKEVYENRRGILHRVFFQRIVLDEAQAIKNHTTRTSIACRGLMVNFLSILHCLGLSTNRSRLSIVGPSAARPS
jgi:SNF2 family DNA or RNA helicase